jgi:uncharacterized membrane protein
MKMQKMDKEQKTTLQLYYAYIASIICNVIPSSTVQTFGLILFIIIFIATYIFRSKAKDKSFMHNHMHYIIKSIWISSLILIIGMIAAYFMADHSIIYNIMENAKNGLVLTQDQLNSILMNYMRANLLVFIVTLTPCLIYLAYRLSKGIVYAKGGYIVPNLKSWI